MAALDDAVTPPSVTPAKKEIDVGDKVPEAQLGVTVNGAVKIIPSASVFKNKKVLLFAVPGRTLLSLLRCLG